MSMTRIPGRPTPLRFPAAHGLYVSADGSFLYLAASGYPSTAIAGYHIAVETGALAPLPEPAFAFPPDRF
jgi:hypothetical protein